MQPGDSLPNMVLKNEREEDVQLRQLIGKPLVLYFYPKDDTPGCTKQACSFRDQFAVFQDLGAVVYGVSNDSPQSHRNFIKEHRLPFSLLCDKGNRLRKAFKVPSNLLGLLPGRVTYIFDKSGKLVATFNSQRNPEQHITESIAVIKGINEAA